MNRMKGKGLRVKSVGKLTTRTDVLTKEETKGKIKKRRKGEDMENNQK